MKRYLDRIEPGLGRRYAEAEAQYRDDQEKLVEWSASGTGPPHLLDLAPFPWMPTVGTFERDAGRLIVLARYAYDLVLRAIDNQDVGDVESGQLRAGVRFSSLDSGGPAQAGRWATALHRSSP